MGEVVGHLLRGHGVDGKVPPPNGSGTCIHYQWCFQSPDRLVQHHATNHSHHITSRRVCRDRKARSEGMVFEECEGVRYPDIEITMSTHKYLRSDVHSTNHAGYEQLPMQCQQSPCSSHPQALQCQQETNNITFLWDTCSVRASHHCVTTLGQVLPDPIYTRHSISELVHSL